MNKIEPEQASKTVATETKLDQPFSCRQYSGFNRIKNFLAYCMRLKPKQRGALKSVEIYQAAKILFRKKILFRIYQEEKILLPEYFEVDNNSKEISEPMNIAKLSSS